MCRTFNQQLGSLSLTLRLTIRTTRSLALARLICTCLIEKTQITLRICTETDCRKKLLVSDCRSMRTRRTWRRTGRSKLTQSRRHIKPKMLKSSSDEVSSCTMNKNIAARLCIWLYESEIQAGVRQRKRLNSEYIALRCRILPPVFHYARGDDATLSFHSFCVILRSW